MGKVTYHVVHDEFGTYFATSGVGTLHLMEWGAPKCSTNCHDHPRVGRKKAKTVYTKLSREDVIAGKFKAACWCAEREAEALGAPRKPPPRNPRRSRRASS